MGKWGDEEDEGDEGDEEETPNFELICPPSPHPLIPATAPRQNTPVVPKGHVYV